MTETLRSCRSVSLKSAKQIINLQLEAAQTRQVSVTFVPSCLLRHSTSSVLISKITFHLVHTLLLIPRYDFGSHDWNTSRRPCREQRGDRRVKVTSILRVPRRKDPFRNILIGYKYMWMSLPDTVRRHQDTSSRRPQLSTSHVSPYNLTQLSYE